MRFIFATTVLLTLGVSNALRLRRSHYRMLEDPEPPSEPGVTRRMIEPTCTNDNVTAALDCVKDYVIALKLENDDLNAELEQCQALLAQCNKTDEADACDGVDNLTDLKDAITGAPSGSNTTIELCTNTTIAPSSAIVIDNKKVNIVCQESKTCTFDGGDKTLIFDVIDSSVVFDGINFVDGSNTYGGAMHISGSTVTIVESKFSGNDAKMYGGGLDIWYSNVTIDKSTFENNAALEQGGAILAMYSDVLITDSTFEENNAKYGGAINSWYGNDTEITGKSVFTKNSAKAGGAISVYDTDLFVTGAEDDEITFIDNEADFGGAAFRVSKSPDKGANATGSKVVLKAVLFADNTLDPDKKGADIFIKDAKSEVTCGEGNEEVTFCDGDGDDQIVEGDGSTNCDTVGETINAACP